MAADTKPRTSSDPNLPTHTRDYAGFITLLKWTMLIVAIIAAAVIYIISN
ncbi:MAG TPA: aa3-type cytochrome c oxidase subunit IV [Sphingomicrobium sp.]|nr:aa3-type cytochrome c oxidase subunit IV [Sphingomicrobium sp.]